MNVSTLCLAILFADDRTGYDIRKFSTDGNFSFFVDASYGSIYPALNRLEKQELVVSRHEEQDGKPDRKVYSITQKGRDAFLKELLLPHKQDVFRSEFLLISVFACLIGPEATQTAIDRQISYLEHELALIQDCSDKERKEAQTNELCDKHALFEEAGGWAQNYGIYCVQASIDYLKEHGAKLVEIAQRGQTAIQNSSGSEIA